MKKEKIVGRMKLRSLRIKKYLSLIEVESQLGINCILLSRIERSRELLDIDMLKQLCKLYGYKKSIKKFFKMFRIVEYEKINLDKLKKIKVSKFFKVRKKKICYCIVKEYWKLENI